MATAAEKKQAKHISAIMANVIEECEPYCAGQSKLLEMLAYAVLSKQHAFLYGPWGCNKSRMISIFIHFIGASEELFKATLTKDSAPEELIGPISPKQLLERDRFVRNLDGTIATHRFAFIGEVFDARSATRKSLHTALNERCVDNDGKSVKIPLLTAFCDSNELPIRREDRPFYDRLMLRASVSYINDDKDTFMKMRRSPRFRPDKVDPICDVEHITNAHKLLRRVRIPAVVDEEMWKLRAELIGKNMRFSDRRWHYAYDILRACAVFRGSMIAEPLDMCALSFVFVDFFDEQQTTLDTLLKQYEGIRVSVAEQSYVNDAQRVLDTAAAENRAESWEWAMVELQTLRDKCASAESISEIDDLITSAKAKQSGKDDADDDDSDDIIPRKKKGKGFAAQNKRLPLLPIDDELANASKTADEFSNTDEDDDDTVNLDDSDEDETDA